MFGCWNASLLLLTFILICGFDYGRTNLSVMTDNDYQLVIFSIILADLMVVVIQTYEKKLVRNIRAKKKQQHFLKLKADFLPVIKTIDKAAHYGQMLHKQKHNQTNNQFIKMDSIKIQMSNSQLYVSK